MSDAQPNPVRNMDGTDDTAARLRVLHNMIAGDERPDTKYIQQLSNVNKIKLICKVSTDSVKTFDIGSEPPFELWLKTMNREKITAGMYLADLRTQYFKLVKSKMSGDATPVDQLVAVADWWFDKFSDILFTMNTGEQPKSRVLH